MTLILGSRSNSSFLLTYFPVCCAECREHQLFGKCNCKIQVKYRVVVEYLLHLLSLFHSLYLFYCFHKLLEIMGKMNCLLYNIYHALNFLQQEILDNLKVTAIPACYSLLLIYGWQFQILIFTSSSRREEACSLVFCILYIWTYY